MPQIHFFFYFSMLKFLTPATWQTSASLFTAETFSWNTENPQTKETKDFFCRSPFFVLLTLHSVPVHNFLNPPSFMYFLIIFFFCYSVTDFQELPAKLQGRQASEISPSILMGPDGRDNMCCFTVDLCTIVSSVARHTGFVHSAQLFKTQCKYQRQQFMKDWRMI